MLTHGDDYPLHQTSLPIAYSGTDRNFFDRYFFNGYSPDGELFFAIALGVYPNINIMDASFCVICDDVQHNIHTSRILNMERMKTQVGPISVEVIEPLQKLAVRLGENEYGIRAELTFQGRVKPIEEPQFVYKQGPRTLFDFTRLTQSGTWNGWLEIQGKKFEISEDRFMGTRDRSWGVRPIGTQDPQQLVPEKPPQYYWVWAPLNFDDCAVFYSENTDAEGKAWQKGGCIASLDVDSPKHAMDVNASLVFESGTRHAKKAELFYNFDDNESLQIILEPQHKFYMTGLGYVNLEWGHGMYKGEDVIGYDSYDLISPSDPALWNLHIQAFCKARLIKDGVEKDGIGVLEQLILGPHAPSGFTDIFDMAP